MSKYVIEFDKEQLLEYDKDTDTYFRTLYKAKGFNALVFDKNGLDKLTPLDKELEEAYKKGFEAGSHEATTLEYQQGLNDAWETITKIAKMPDGEKGKVFGETWISNILNGNSLGEITEKLKAYEQRTGKWIPQDHNKRVGNISTCVYYLPICSKCGKVGNDTYKYCPHCGAKMISEGKTCDCYRDGTCTGTKEIDPCSCGGDKSKCDFYENVRREGDAE